MTASRTDALCPHNVGEHPFMMSKDLTSVNWSGITAPESLVVLLVEKARTPRSRYHALLNA